jgi:hypothetical protein
VAEEMLIEIANNYDRIALRAVEQRSQKAEGTPKQAG